jgi:hypothetical protein
VVEITLQEKAADRQPVQMQQRTLAAVVVAITLFRTVILRVLAVLEL